MDPYSTEITRGLVVHPPHTGDERLEYRLRLHGVVAVLEIDVVRREPILLPNRLPERLVFGQLRRRSVGEARQNLGTEHQAEGCAAHRADEFAFVHGSSGRGRRKERVMSAVS